MHRRSALPPTLLGVALAQDRCFTTAQAAAHGVGRQGLGLATDGAWGSAGYGVWTLRDDPDDGRSVAERLLAAARRRGRVVQLARPEAVACDDLAAELAQLDGWWTGGAQRHSVPLGHSRRSGWRRRQLDDADVVDLGGIRATAPMRTILDLLQAHAAGSHLDELLELLIESALRQRLVTLEELCAAALRRGNEALRAVLRRRAGAPPTESMLETLALRLARVAGLPEPTRQLEIVDEEGRVVARVDFAWLALRLILEVDGSHHLDQRLHDEERDLAIFQATGCMVVHLRWRHIVDRPRATARRLASLAKAGMRS